MQSQRIIERLGYSPNEARVYLASLALGEAQVSDISEKVDMPRTTVQAIVERLREGGLMSFYVVRRHKYWVAEDPSQLLIRLKEHEVMLEEIIPRLVALKQKARQRNKDFKKLEDLGSLREVADGMKQPVLVANSDAEIRYVNDAWQDLFGHQREELFGRHARVLKSGQTAPEEYRRLWRALRADRLFESSAITDRKKDGTLFTPFTIIFPVTYGNRKFYVQILEDRQKQNGDAHAIKQEFADAAKD